MNFAIGHLNSALTTTIIGSFVLALLFFFVFPRTAVKQLRSFSVAIDRNDVFSVTLADEEHVSSQTNEENFCFIAQI